MKRFLAALCLCGLASGALGQGLVRLANNQATLVTLNIPGSPNWPPPGNLLFALVTAPAGTTDLRVFKPTGVLAINSSVRGLVSGEIVAVPGWPVGETRAFAIVGWSASLGANFNPAWLCLCEGCLSGFGVSPIRSGSPGGISQAGPPPLLPLNPFQTINSGLVLGGPLSPEFCPTIVTQPSSQTALSGSTVTFTVVAQSRPQPLTYQWQFNGTNLPGATSSALVLTNVQTSQAGAYSVTVANGLSAISSSLAILVVGVPPSISTSPQSQTVSAGSTVDFVVIASGSPPLVYNWFFNGTNSLSGSTDSVLELRNVQSADAGNYTVAVNNAYGAVTSSPAFLTVIPSPPTIVRSPPSHTAIVGWSLDLTVSAHGSLPLSYQWFFNGNAISGASDDDLHLASLRFSQSGTYSVLVTNVLGTVTSAPAILNVIPLSPNPPAGTVVAWGDHTIPYVAPGTRFTAIAAGSLHSLAIKSDGTVVAWGDNSYGQSIVPAGLRDVVAIAGGGYGLPSHSLALKSDGTVVSWGSDYSLRQNTGPAGLSGIIAISTGVGHSLVLTSDGRVVAWGGNTYGQTNVPTGLSGVVGIAAGGYHSLAVKSDGTVVAWGDNSWGQTNTPAGLSGVIAVAAAYLHSLALKSDGTVISWGLFGQSTVPAGLSGVTAIAAKGYHSLALKSDGTVVAWGGYDDVPADLSHVIAIAAGEEHSLALKSDGTVVAWGSNDYGQSIVPGSFSGVIALASGG